MTGYKEFIYRYGAILCSLLLMVFSFFIPYSLPVRLISFASLIAASLIIAKDLRSPEDFKKIFGRFVSANATLLFCATGLAAGILFAILYRWHLGIRLFRDRSGLSLILQLSSAAWKNWFTEAMYRFRQIE